MRCRLNKTIVGAAALLTIAALLPAGSVLAQPYTQLQVLLPGETAAPNTGTGKVGAPLTQTVGIPFTITVRACDANWNTVSTITNIVQITSSDGTASLPSNTALTGGTAQLSVTLNASGSFTISADDQTDPTIPLATSANVTALLLASFEFDRINQKNQYAGVPMSTMVRAVDPGGNTVTGYNGPVHLQETTSFGVGRITPEIVTMSNGVWSGNVTMYRADETSINRGNVNMDAYLDSNPNIKGTSDPFTIHPGSFSRVQIVVPGQSAWPGSVTGLTGFPASQSAGQAFTVEVRGTDNYWNKVPTADVVRITSSDPAASTPVSGALTDGFAQFTLSLGTTGTQTLTVTDQTNGSIQSMTSAGIPVGASAPDHFEIDPIPSPIVAGSSITATIRATDVSGNTVPGYNGNAILSANTGPGSISPEAITFSNGVWTGTMTFRGAGNSVAFSCADYATPPHLGTSNTFEVQPGPYTGLQVLLPGQTPAGGTASGFIGMPTDQNAGSSFSVTVRAVDQYWNRVNGINNAISVVSTDAFAVVPADTNLINGELVFPATLFKVGPQTVTASDTDSTSINSHTSSPVEILPGTYSRIVIVAPGQWVAAGAPNGQAGAALDQSINFAFTVSVYATDQWFNPVTGVTDMVHITSSDPLAQLPADAAMVDGRVDLSVRLSTGGFQQITAQNVTQPGMPTSTTQVRAISSGLHLEAEVAPTAVQAGEPFNLTVKVVNDAGAVIQEVNTSVSIEVQNASTRLPGQGTLANSQFQLLQGQRTMPEYYTFAEDIVLIVRDDAGNTPAVTEVVSVSPGQPKILELSSSPPWVGGNKHALLSATVLDTFRNGVATQPVTFMLLSGSGSITPIDSLSDVTGLATCDFLSPREPEIARIRAISGSLLAEIYLETALVDPNKSGGTVTNYPNPFHPNEAPTTVAYKLNSDATVTMRIFTLTGGLVLKRVYDAGTQGGLAGLNTVQWDGKNGSGETVATGGYILLIQANANGETIHTMRRKVAVVR